MRTLGEVSKKERSYAAPLFHRKEDERDFLFGWKRPEMIIEVGDIFHSLSIHYTDGYKSVDTTHPWERGAIDSKNWAIGDSVLVKPDVTDNKRTYHKPL